MANSKWRVSADISQGQRSLLLRLCRPSHPNVFLQQFTWIYGEDAQTASYPRGELVLTLDGRHVCDRHEALVGSVAYASEGVGAARTRPDGKPVHITVSTAVGVPPAAASEIDPDKIVPIPPIELRLRLHRSRATQLQPTKKAA